MEKSRRYQKQGTSSQTAVTEKKTDCGFTRARMYRLSSEPADIVELGTGEVRSDPQIRRDSTPDLRRTV